MVISIKRAKEAHKILENYNGNNPYIKWLKNSIYVKKDKTLTDSEIDYIIRNHAYQAEKINKVVKLAKWFVEKQMEKWEANRENKMEKMQGRRKMTHHKSEK